MSRTFLIGLALCMVTGAEPPGLEKLAGRWQGECRSFPPISVKALPIGLMIAPDGTVSGTVGDAKIIDGRIRARAWYEPKPFNHFEYRLDFGLEGFISKQDEVAREGGRINVSWFGDELKGWFVSSGPHVGGPDVMQISTRGLLLRRVK